jgi:hypothetical protein
LGAIPEERAVIGVSGGIILAMSAGKDAVFG